MPEDEPGSWKLSAHGWELTAPNGTAIALTVREHRTLERLIQAGGEVVVKRELAMDIFGGAVINCEQRLEVLLSRLRGKIRAVVEFPMPIQSAHAAGYAFTAAARID